MDPRSPALIEALCLVLPSVIFGAKASGSGVPWCLTWSQGQWHVHKLLVIPVESGHLHLVQELPMAVNLAEDSVGRRAGQVTNIRGEERLQSGPIPWPGATCECARRMCVCPCVAGACGWWGHTPLRE